MAEKNRIRMLRVSESVWEALMRMKLDLKKGSVDALLTELLKLKEGTAKEAKENKSKESKAEETKKEEKAALAAAG